MKFMNESMYGHGAAMISNCLNKFIHEVLGRAPAIILNIFFCKIKIFPLLEDLPQKSIKYFIID